MATYLMFGSYSLEGMKAISPARTAEATTLIEQHGGKLKAAYVLLGKIDLVLIVDMPDTAHAMKASAALSSLLDISFNTAPAITVEEFDTLMA